MKRILIVGASSAIAEATARLFAQRGDALFLTARRAEVLDAIAQDLKTRGASIAAGLVLDANDFERHQELFDRAEASLGALDIVLIAHGSLPDQNACEASVEATLDAFKTNALSAIGLCTTAAARMQAKGSGCIAVISSVAGERGRRSNYVYGAAKGALTIFLQGLRNRLHRAGVHVLTIKPGFVDTPMTSAFAKGPLWAKPHTVARGIVQAIDARRDIVYLPGFWRFIMIVVRSIPERIFKRLSL